MPIGVHRQRDGFVPHHLTPSPRLAPGEVRESRSGRFPRKNAPKSYAGLDLKNFLNLLALFTHIAHTNFHGGKRAAESNNPRLLLIQKPHRKFSVPRNEKRMEVRLFYVAFFVTQP